MPRRVELPGPKQPSHDRSCSPVEETQAGERTPRELPGSPHPNELDSPHLNEQLSRREMRVRHPLTEGVACQELVDRLAPVAYVRSRANAIASVMRAAALKTLRPAPRPLLRDPRWHPRAAGVPGAEE